jgi:hypothetical protein
MEAMHTTNYYNTFIEIAEDCPLKTGDVPPQKGAEKTIANIQFDILYGHPYKYTSDDVLFETHATKRAITDKEEKSAERELFFSKGQACFRSSPLTKRYGWGIHSNADGKIAMYAAGSDEYKKMAQDQTLKHVKAMRSKKA